MKKIKIFIMFLLKICIFVSKKIENDEIKKNYKILRK